MKASFHKAAVFLIAAIAGIAFSVLFSLNLSAQISQSVKTAGLKSAAQSDPAVSDKSTDNPFGAGFDPSRPVSWAKYKPFSHLLVTDGAQEDPLFVPASEMTGQMALGKLERYQTSAAEDPLIIAIKLDDLLAGSRDVAVSAASGDPGSRSLVRKMVNIADDAVRRTDAAYSHIQEMSVSVDMMKLQLSRNYGIFNTSAKSEKHAAQFNAQSDAMAERVSGMLSAATGMRDRAAVDREILTGMMDVLEEMASEGRDGLSYDDRVSEYLKNAGVRFEGMVKDLAAQGASDPAGVEQARQYFAALQKYVQSQKSYADSQTNYFLNVKKYLQKNNDYLAKVVTDLDTTHKDLRAVEGYFRGSRVSPSGPGRDIVAAAADQCSAPPDEYKLVNGEKIKKTARELEEEKPLQALEDCAKSCRTVCRFKDKRGGQNCYECPSGSPDSCYDVGAWPASHPWCQPGGPCYDDPMMYCSPFGTVSPTNKEKLECTHCKVRPDMCHQKVGGGMTYTNCKLGCWNGKCVYKGKYEEFEWDGKKEWIHCYECKTPPGPPSCEDLGWGYSWKSDCEKNCPNPGQCVEKNNKVPGKPEPPGGGAPPAAPPAGQGEGQSGGTGTGGGAAPGGDKPKPADLPGGTPEQPTGGSVAGGKPETGSGPTTGEPEKPGEGIDAKPGEAPTMTGLKKPAQPSDDKPVEPLPPPPPPTNPQIEFYKSQLKETEDRIRSREAIINDSKESDAVKDEARRQLEGMTRERDRTKERIAEEEQRELEKIKDEQERKKRAEEYERTRERPKDYAQEARKRGEALLLSQLRSATQALEDKLKEARDTITGRRERLQKIRDEIAYLERENQHYQDGTQSGHVDSDVAKTRTRENLERIKQLKEQYVQLEKKLREATQQFNEELERLKSDYRRALWAYDKKSQARADAERTDEYFERYSELQNLEATRAERNRTFDELARNMESEIAAKKAKGEDTSELERQLENMRRGQAEWNESMDRQQKSIESQLHELEWRNFREGAGPSSPENLGQSLEKYAKNFQDQLTQTQGMIAELEKNSSRTREQNELLKTLKAQVPELQNSIAAVAEKQAQFKSGALSEEHRQRVHDTTVRVATGAMNTQADKSFARLFGESLVEEVAHTANPLVLAKKSIAFGVGVVQGVGTAVVGLAELGIGAVDLTLETYLTNLGFDIETDALDSLNSVIDTVSSHSNFDGVIKAVVAAGGAIDKKMTELEKSADIDWATAQFGGKVAGELVVADKVIAGALGKAGEALGLVDEGLDAARAGAKVEDASTAVRGGEKAAGALPETSTLPAWEPPPSAVADDVRSAGSAAGKADSAPRAPPESGKTVPHSEVKTLPHEHVPQTLPHSQVKTLPPEIPSTPKPGEIPATPKPEAPTTPKTNIEPPAPQAAPQAGSAPRGGIGADAQASFVDASGKTVTVKTGEELGHGSTSVVYADPTDVNKAIRITEPGKAGIAKAAQLDEAGRQAIASLERPGGPIRMPKNDPPVTVNDPSSPLHGKIVQSVERIKNGDAQQFLKGGPMSEGQAKALDAAMKELNTNGYAWMDNHAGNYAFEQVGTTGDNWRVVVLDPGGIVKMHSVDDAIALQQRMSQGDDGLRAMVKEGLEKRAKWAAANPGKQRGKDLLDNIISAESGDIMNNFADKIDYKAMGLDSPYDIAFYPFGTLDYANVQALTLGR